MTERVRRLREISTSGRPKLSEERARLVTEAYRLHSGRVSTPVLRALVFRHLLQQKKITIFPDELLVGERGDAPLSTPTYPELCCHSQQDLRTIREREKIAFDVDDAMIDYYAEQIIPFWQGKSMRDRITTLMAPDWQACYAAGIFTEFMEQRAPGHTVADQRIYQQGFTDHIRDIDAAISRIDRLNDPKAYERLEELKAMRICAQSLIDFAARYSELAGQLAERETDPQRAAELKMIEQVTRRVPAQAPTTLWEALQMYWFVHIGVISELNTWDSFNPGRLDQHLISFFKQDTANGVSQESIKELLQCFWIKFNNQPAPPKVGITLQESGTYTDFANINLGGLRADGSDGVNELSYMLLDIIDEMAILQPSSNIQLSRKSPERFLEHACKVIRKGRGQPSVFNADAVIEEMLRQGKSIEDARCGGTSGCVETGAFGKESYILTGYLNLVKILEITLNQGLDPQTGQQIGLPLALPDQKAGYAALFDCYRQQLEHFIDIKMAGNHLIEKLYMQEMPAPFLSIIIADCIGRGLDYHAGGARYNTSYIQGVGIGTITDSLSSLRQLVYQDESFGLEEFRQALAADFNGHERLQQAIARETARYGNDLDQADRIMQDVFELFYNAVNDRPNMKGGLYHIDMLPTTCHVYFGQVTGATPDGRLRGQPVSEGISPVQGADVNGPTAVIKSASKMDHLRTGGTLLNLKFTPGLLDHPAGLKGLASLIRTYFSLDGHHVQFNVVNRQTLLDAQKHPEKHRDLIVRVAGYSDYFNNLNLNLQNELIQRSEHVLT